MQKLIKENCHGILIYLELSDDKKFLKDVSLELVSKAYELSQQINEKIYGVLISNIIEKDELLYQNLFKGLPLENIRIYEKKLAYNTEIDVQAVCDCIEKIKPSIVLFGSTDRGKFIAPQAAVFFQTGLTADCTDFVIDRDNNLMQIRPAFGGNIMADIITRKSRPQMATVRQHIFTKNLSVLFCQEKSPQILFENNIVYKTCQTVKNVSVLQSVDDIGQEKILIAVGKGLKKKEDLILCNKLAELLGGKIASSRGLVERGWMPSEKQIGLSGHTVNPDVIITFGISGSVQFMAGLKNCKRIIAINNDINAPIFNFAHYSICGDLYKIIPKMIKDLEN